MQSLPEYELPLEGVASGQISCASPYKYRSCNRANQSLVDDNSPATRAQESRQTSKMAVSYITDAGIALILSALIYRFLLYPVFFSPLSRIPNAHFTSPISPAWIIWKRFRETNNRTIHEAHKRLGPIVRLGPSEISVNCVEGGIKTVYGGGFEKHDWYPRVFGSFG